MTAMLISTKTISELLQEANDAECDEILDALMKARGHEMGDYKSLARELVAEYRPNFRPRRFVLEHGTWGGVIRKWGGVKKVRPGRPEYWTLARLVKLAKDVDDAKARLGAGTTDAEAVCRLAMHRDWSRPLRRTPEGWQKTLKNMLPTGRLIAYLLE
jgi:hypothetical protein